MQGTPYANQWQESAVSAEQLLWSTNLPQGSVPEFDGPPMLVVVLVPEDVLVGAPTPDAPVADPALGGEETAPPEPQLHWQGGHAAPGAQGGQAQTQVPLSTQPPPEGPPLPDVQLHAPGRQSAPGAHAIPEQVHVPPEPELGPPPAPLFPEEEPPEQSHSGGGQGAPTGQAMGVTQPQLVLFSLGWQ
jgi:hypothetical protein